MAIWRWLVTVASILFVTSITGPAACAQEETPAEVPAAEAPAAEAPAATTAGNEEEEEEEEPAGGNGSPEATPGAEPGTGPDANPSEPSSNGATPGEGIVPAGLPLGTARPASLDSANATGLPGEPVVAQALSAPVEASLAPGGTREEKRREAESERDAARKAFDEARERLGGDIPQPEAFRLAEAERKLSGLRQEQTQQDLEAAARALKDTTARHGRGSPEAAQAREQYARAHQAYQEARPRGPLNSADPWNLPRMIAEDLRTRGPAETANRYFVPGAAAPISFANGLFQSAARVVPRTWQSLAVSKAAGNEVDRRVRGP